MSVGAWDRGLWLSFGAVRVGALLRGASSGSSRAPETIMTWVLAPTGHLTPACGVRGWGCAAMVGEPPALRGEGLDLRKPLAKKSDFF